MEAPDEEAGLGLLHEGEQILEVALISAQGLKPPSSQRRRLQAYAVAWVDAGHKIQTQPDDTGGLDPVVHGLLNVATSLVAVPPSPAACHALRLSQAVSLRGLSVVPTPSRALRVLNRAHSTPPPSPRLLTPKKQQMVVNANNKVADDASDEEGAEEDARGMGGVVFCGPCVLPLYPRKIRTSPSDENLQAYANVFSGGLKHCRTEPSFLRSPGK
ncbi:C2 domain containing protein [Zea mays]|uniref:C2 domain containing protein n=1 Tax=Zea mays TaxID=4577 RepID=A0A1D6G0V2_MAIZE|nr:C2 domain containing protein [Zea mays]